MHTLILQVYNCQGIWLSNFTFKKPSEFLSNFFIVYVQSKTCCPPTFTISIKLYSDTYARSMFNPSSLDTCDMRIPGRRWLESNTCCCSRIRCAVIFLTPKFQERINSSQSNIISVPGNLSLGWIGWGCIFWAGDADADINIFDG